jgi:hypothetical protein
LIVPRCRQVWVCLLRPAMPAGCGFESPAPAPAVAGGRRDLACYVYLEGADRFAYWGRNSDLRLVSAAEFPDQSPPFP